MPDREQIDEYFGHPGFAGSEHPLAAGRERPSQSGPDRFRLEVVYPDGVPRPVSRHDTLREAVAAKHAERQAHLDAGHPQSSFALRLTDEDDPERGDLDEEDLDDE